MIHPDAGNTIYAAPHRKLDAITRVLADQVRNTNIVAARSPCINLACPKHLRNFYKSCLSRSGHQHRDLPHPPEESTKQGFIDWPTDASGMRRQLSPAADKPPPEPYSAKCHKRTHAVQQKAYSITSSAVSCMINGTVRPSDRAVLRFMANKNFVGCSTGNSPGLAPWRTRPI